MLAECARATLRSVALTFRAGSFSLARASLVRSRMRCSSPRAHPRGPRRGGGGRIPRRHEGVMTAPPGGLTAAPFYSGRGRVLCPAPPPQEIVTGGPGRPNEGPPPPPTNKEPPQWRPT